MSSVDFAWPTVIWSSDCELMKASLIAGKEIAHSCTLRQRSSPVISESW